MAEDQQSAEFEGAAEGSKVMESVRSNMEKLPSSEQQTSSSEQMCKLKEDSPQIAQNAPETEAALATPPKSLITLMKDGDGDNDGSPRSVASFGRGSLNRDMVLAKLNQEKSLSLIKAWEENTKAKSLHRYNKKLAKIAAWESAKKAKAEAELKALEERLERKKAECIERMKNEIAAVHMRAEEEKALADSHHGEELLKAEETAAKYRASGSLPKRYPFCCTF
ncbi:hypothetical protein KP509_24G038800 [Ceratopteris richardii]|uniref:Remorin C-terminal domain-containing protein n=1 Tax=Ceratopteris richardii TaxID=49495 RepID=A0A8T2RW74_CERRI|nr:hypothetical protein KP509_24G038800 [Ceratopteris richardii]KAH7299974.1 hypothetical protein KP509_24G038800 [Ceratopteris richardii]